LSEVAVRILLVDSEPSILVSMSEALREDGHQVMAAPDVANAAREYGRSAIDLLIADVNLRGASGLGLAEAVRAVHPTLAVILTTSDGWVCGAFDPDRVLTKPFSPTELRRAVRALERGGRGVASVLGMKKSHAPIQRILCPVDFSPCSEAALRYATSLADAVGADVEVLHVFWEVPPYLPVDPTAFGMPADGTRTMTTYLRDQSQERLDALVAQLDERWHHRIAKRSMAGEPGPRIVEACEAEGYDLVVMGTHGHGALRRVLLGSVADKVVRASPVPVLIVPQVPEA
jgi:nucleotide-binding universal stress UspA family protein/CheY-like chemotaxis protein